MKLDLLRILQLQRDLYDLPRDMTRFRQYIATMTGGTDDLALPIGAMNPMGKDKAKAAYDALLAIDAEEIAATAVKDAQRRLAGVNDALKVALVVADDVQGGWTHREMTEAKYRLSSDSEAKRGWAAAVFWTSETPTPETVRSTVLSSIFRATWLRRTGVPKTLRDMMRQEGLAARFAGVRPSLAPPELAKAKAVIDPLRSGTSYVTAYAAMYGDEAARTAGYPPLGLAPRAGYELATDEAWERPEEPEAAFEAAPTSRRGR